MGLVGKWARGDGTYVGGNLWDCSVINICVIFTTVLSPQPVESSQLGMKTVRV